MNKWKKRMTILNIVIIASMLISSMQYVQAAELENTVFINEIESNDSVTGIDWVEIINTGNSDIDISGWFVTDDKGLERLIETEEWRVGENTVLKAGEILVIEHDVVLGNLSLGKDDTASLYDSSDTLLDSYTYTGHAFGTYSRVPDGTGEFVDQEPTKGELNIVEKEELPKHRLLINEINSQPDDWVEFINLGTEEMDLSGYEIRDNSEDHRWKFAEGTILQAGELIVVDENTIGERYDDQAEADVYVPGTFSEAIGIGGGDSIRLFDNGENLLDEYSWTAHAIYEGDAALASFGRYPDGTGSFGLMKETKGSTNDWYKPQIVINEVESNDDVTDWVEVYNVGTTAVDISGWYLYDDDPVGHAADINPVEDGTMLNPGGFYVFDGDKQFTFGLGKADQVTIFNKDGVSIAEYSWLVHANGVYARIPDGTGELVEFPTSTKGKANVVTNSVILNEVQSNDLADGPDWIELANPTGEVLDISGIIIKDNDDTHQYVIPNGTTIPAYGFLVLTDEKFGFGLGKNDSVRLFENERLIASTTWPEHTNPTWGLYPDVTGNEYRHTKEATIGAVNKFNGIPEMIAWPGNGEVVIYDQEPTFLEDSSGLDFMNGQLYAVDNGTGKFWILDVSKAGKLSFAKGFEDGKRVRFQKDADDARAAGPDAEGITVDGEGFVYIASERDNNVKGVNFNMILQVDPHKEGDDLVALQQWDLTPSLPQVSANMGIESVEWVSNKNVNGLLFDLNTNAVFDATNYPNAMASGVFFVALEDNGHVYAYVLNEDGSSVQIADIDGKIGGAMALDYDTYENVLWVVADNGFNNRAAKIVFNGEKETEIIHIVPASGVDINANNEGFAIAEVGFTRNGQRPVYRFKDGEKFGSLSIGSITSNYKESVDNDSGNTGNTGTGNPGKETNYEANIIGSGTTLSVPITVNSNAHNASFEIGAEQQNALLGGQAVTITVPSIDGVDNYTLNTSANALSSAKGGSLTMNTNAGNVTLPSNMLSNMGFTANVSITIGEADTTKLSDAIKASVGNKPLISLSLTINDQSIAWNNPNASVTVSIPYKPTAEELENSESIVIWYIDGDGNVSSVTNGRYDADKEAVIFNTNHFSLFSVGYNEVDFDDVSSSDWYNKAISFIAARGITVGTDNDNYSPNATITRGDFLVLLMRATELAEDESVVNNYSDAGNTYYTGYLAAAKRLGISSGVGHNMYAPEKKITRQEMFTMIYNTLEVIDQLPNSHYSKTLNDFSDAAKIDTWALSAVTHLVEMGVVNGDDDKLDLNRTATRAEMAQILYNLLTK